MLKRKCGICKKITYITNLRDITIKLRKLWVCLNCLEYMEAITSHFKKKDNKQLINIIVDINNLKKIVYQLGSNSKEASENA